MNAEQLFTQKLLAWYDPTARPMPWKNERDPYKIWLSEIILQQTRVEQGLPYFLKFTAAFPTIKNLANADEETVFKLWEGLGYYTRARNLHKTAKFISDHLNGSFPTSYEEILRLPGVGPYTAAAIASFAYGLPNAVLDGNVYRVLARVFGIETPIDSTTGKAFFTKKSDELLDKKQAGKYNQAIMDFGATVCAPAKPSCSTCPMRDFCRAFREKKVGDLPVKSKVLKKRDRFFHYFIFQKNDEIWVRRRVEKDIWQGLFEFPMMEKTVLETDADALLKMASTLFFEKITLKSISKPYKQTLTHQKISAIFCEILVENAVRFQSEHILIKQIDLKNIPLPRIIDLYFQENQLLLALR
jgi:A/G-specific adenine glycosylase